MRRVGLAALALLALTACGGQQATLDEALSTTKPPTPITEVEQSVAEDLQGMSNGPGQISVDCPQPAGRRYSIICTVEHGAGVTSVADAVDGVGSVRVTGNRYGGFSWGFAE